MTALAVTRQIAPCARPRRQGAAPSAAGRLAVPLDASRESLIAAFCAPGAATPGLRVASAALAGVPQATSGAAESSNAGALRFDRPDLSIPISRRSSPMENRQTLITKAAAARAAPRRPCAIPVRGRAHPALPGGRRAGVALIEATGALTMPGDALLHAS
jgi:hypothetical protein